MTENAGERILLIESQYFAPIDVYKTLVQNDVLCLERYEHYQKVSYRNRCYIAGPNGRITLSVPLSKGKNQRTVMKDVRISNEERWQSLHWKTLVSAYRRSPWFEYFEADLETLYSKPFDFLLDWNIACLEWVNRQIGLTIPVTFTNEFQKEVTASGVTDARDTILPLPASTGEPTYTQVFQERIGFIPNLSILDLLFCEGKQSLKILS
ncbi:hypothetical protein DVR12_18570 [Chitinophaga silvatica]|uniref:WbqC-like protein family protein n=1 Tax=Chitinophaga silvatica TaxID=2282649 RepID=A0A3E1Y6M7_9BACT|nr:WbqC family protein [Chitinophaga silvatica]RFS20567.1 hypothetical protein DVR12_18570 [Chitinophaga silvatica]